MPVVSEIRCVRNVHITETRGALKPTMAPHIYIRKKRRLEKELRHINRRGEKNLKPIEEYEVPVPVKRDIAAGIRTRENIEFPAEQLERHVLLEKEWARYKLLEHLQDAKVLKRLRGAQTNALNKLREESEELYKQAIQLDDTLLPSTFKGPVHTPPIKDYLPADGKYIDATNYFNNEDFLSEIYDSVQAESKKKRRK